MESYDNLRRLVESVDEDINKAKAGNKDLSINLGVEKDFPSANILARLAKQRASSEAWL